MKDWFADGAMARYCIALQPGTTAFAILSVCQFFVRLRICCNRTADDNLVKTRPDQNVISLSDAVWEGYGRLPYH